MTRQRETLLANGGRFLGSTYEYNLVLAVVYRRCVETDDTQDLFLLHDLILNGLEVIARGVLCEWVADTLDALDDP